MTATHARQRPANRRKPPKKRFPVFGVVIGAVVLIGLIAVLATRGGDDDGTTTTAGVEQNRPVTVSGDPLPPLPEEGEDPAVGAKAPEVEGADFEGNPVSISDDGRAKLVVFLAHWCPHCQNEVPVIVDWLADADLPQRFDVLAVSTGVSSDRPNYPPSAWLAREDWPVRTLADSEDQKAAAIFNLPSYPYFVAIDRDGAVVARGTGELSREQIEELVTKATANA